MSPSRHSRRAVDRIVALGWLTTACLSSVACPAPAGIAQDSSAAATAPADLLVTGGTVVTMDAARTVIEDGAIAVRDGAIVAVGTSDDLRAVWDATEVVEAAPDDLVTPGLVNGHGHAAMVLLRGIADDLALMDWLQNYIFPAEARTVSPEMVEVGTRLAVMEMIGTGTTTFVDGYYFMEQAARVVDETGMRAVVGQTVIGFPAPDHATPEAAIEWTEGFIERWKDHPRVIAAPAPHAPYTVSGELLQRTAELARAHGVPNLIHLAETRDEIAQIAEREGTTPVAWLDSLGVLGPELVGAHGVWLDDRDIALLASSGTGIVHNPESNLKLASGTARVPDLIAAGVAVGIGTDGAASNNDLDLFDALSLAAFLQKHMAADPTALPAADVLEMATLGGARALGLDDRIGSLEVGKRADIVVLRGDAASLVPRYEIASHLVYAASGHHVRTTIVEGRVLYLDGRYLTLDPDAVIGAARAMAVRIREAVAAAR